MANPVEIAALIQALRARAGNPSPQGEYAQGSPPVHATMDSSMDVQQPGVAPGAQVTPQSMQEARMQNRLRYGVPPAQNQIPPIGRVM